MASREQRDAAIQNASSRVQDGCMYCGVRPAEVEALRAERDRYRADLKLIADHAALDFVERGIAEFERYEVIACDSLAKGDP